MLDSEIYTIPLEHDRYLIYAPLRHAALVGNTAMVNEIGALRPRNADRTQQPVSAVEQLMRELDVYGAGPEPLPITSYSGRPCPTNLTLFLTTGCNLRCTYCYASAGDTPIKSMPFDVAKDGIDFIVGNAVRKRRETVEINFHGGGEPTVNWETLTRSFNYAFDLCAQHGIELVATTATNGVISRSRLAWIVDHLNDVSLSYDGLPETHDTHRKTISGAGSSSAVIDTMRYFDEHDFPYGVRVTVTRDQIPTLPESVEFIWKNFSPHTIQVEPSYQLGRWRDEPSAETSEFIASYREAQCRASSLGRCISFSGARLGTLTNHFCGVTQDSFALSANGAVSACYEVFDEMSENADMFIYGQPDSITGAYRFDLDKLDHLRAQAVQFRDYCKGCFAKWSCGGDCYNKSVVTTGKREFAGSDRCHIIRELTKDQILQAIADSGGMYWKGISEDAEDLDDTFCSECNDREMVT